MKKYDFSMKKYDFLPSRPPLRSGGQKNNYKTFVKNAQWRAKKQTFCKNAQWRAKKLRERGSNTARPREKGGGGLPIGARPVDFGASFRADSVASRRDLQTSSWRFVPKPGATPRDTEDKTQKKARLPT